MPLKRTLSSVLLLSLATPAFGLGRADVIRTLIDEGRIDVAALRCDRMMAHLSDTPKDLREVCAEAKFEEALEANQVMRWIEFQQVWRGTSYATTARDNEAAAALRDLGNDAQEHEYATFMRMYKDTKFALAAKAMLKDSAIRSVQTGEEAVRVAKMYPDHKDTPLLVEKFLPYFLKMEMNGLDVKVTIDPPIPIAGPAPTGRWAVKTGEESYMAWADSAETHLKDIGVGQAFIQAAKKDGYPPCQIPGADWELGVLVEVGSGKAFFPNRGVPECTRRAWPAFVVYDNGRMSALSLGPSNTVRFPTDPAKGSFDWGAGDDLTKVWTPGAAGDPLLVNEYIGQPVGNLYLLTPLSGGMPHYVNIPPPAGAMAVPVEARTSALPARWELVSGGAPFQPGQTASGEIDVSAGALAGTPWKLPAGQIRVMSPLVQQLTGLNQHNDALKKSRKPRMPPIAGSTGPMGATPITLTQLDQGTATAVERQLNGAGVPVRIWRAWDARVSGTSGGKDTVFDGEVAGTPVKGVMDPTGGGFRVWIWERDARSQQGPEDVLSFILDGATYFVWKGKGDKGEYSEAIHMDETGLVREFR